jgi:PBSX family phage terminase large subunit
VELNQFGEKSYNIITTPIKDDPWITILHGAVRSAKTFTLIPKIFALVADGPRQGIGIISGVSKETIYTNILRDLFDIVGESRHHYNRSTGELNLMGDKWKVVGAKDEGSEKYIRGATVGKAICDEGTLMPESFFNQLLARMSPEGSRLYMTTNADSPYHYLYTNFIDDQDKKMKGLVKAHHFDLDDNPSLSEEYKHRISNAHKGVFHLRYVKGLWVVAEGAVYKDSWSPDLVFNDETTPQGLPRSFVDRWIASDYGTIHNHVYLDFIDDGRDVWVIRELVWCSVEEGVQRTDSQHADALEEFLKPDGVWPSARESTIVVPPEAASFRQELVGRGLLVKDADNTVLDGIRVTSSLMALKRLHVHERCVRLLKGIGTYGWNLRSSLRGVEEPVKDHDDEVDALRYGIKTMIPWWRLEAGA